MPRLRLGNFGANVKRKQSRQSADPEHPSPTESRQHKARSDGGQQISPRVSALQDARENAAPLGRRAFHGQRCADAPFATHTDSVQRSKNEEESVVGSKSTKQFDERKEDDIGHQRNAASVAIGEDAEDERADGTRSERGRGGRNDQRF